MISRTSPRCAVLLVLVLLVQAGQAATLTDLLLSARQRDPAYAIAQAQYGATEQRVRQARAGLLPTMNFTGSATKANYDQEALQDRRFNTEQWAYQFTQPLYRPANFRALDQSQRQLAQAGAQVAAAESDLAVRVTGAWFDVLSTQEIIRAITAQKAATQQQLAMAKRSFEIGTASIADAREAEAKHALVLAQEAQAQSDLAIKRATLAQVTGTPIEEVDGLPWMRPDLQGALGTLETWSNVSRTGNPTLVQARYGLEAAELEIDKARAGHLPTVDFNVNHSFNNATGSATSTFPQHNKTTQYGISVSMPLFSGFATDAKVKEAMALQDKARGDLAQAEDQVALGVKQAWFGLRGAIAQIDALERARSANEISTQATQRGYQVGMRTNVDVLNALAQQYQTEKDLAKARTDAWLYYIRLRIFTGAWSAKDLNAF